MRFLKAYAYICTLNNGRLQDYAWHYLYEMLWDEPLNENQHKIKTWLKQGIRNNIVKLLEEENKLEEWKSCQKQINHYVG